MSDIVYVQTQFIPLSPIPAQQLAISLSGQPCKLNVYQKLTGVFLDLLINDVQIVGGVICQNGNPLIRGVYLGFIGQLVFWDFQGNDDPDYTGFGTRFLLTYYS